MATKLIGTITEQGFVKTKSGQLYAMDFRGTDDEGYPQVLMDAKSVGGTGWMHRQSIKPFIGMQCSFITNNGKNGYNFTVIKH